MSKRMKLSVDIPKDWEDHQLLYVMLVKKDEDGKLIDALKVPAEIESTEEINGDNPAAKVAFTYFFPSLK